MICRLPIADATKLRCTRKLSFPPPITSIGISKFVGSRILMSMDSGLSFSRSSILRHLFSTNAGCDPTQLSHRNIAFRDSELQEYYVLENPDSPTPNFLGSSDMHPQTMDGSELVGISRLAILQFLLHKFGASTRESPIHDITCRSDGRCDLGSTALPS
jgi:hypothetical protein